MNVTQLPEGYREIKTVDLLNNIKKLLTVNLAALLLGIVMVLPAAFLVPFHAFQKGFVYSLLVPLLFLVALFLYVLLHEAVHGVFMKKLSNVKPYFGFKGLMYAYAGSTAFFDKRSYMLIAMAPVVLIGLILLLANLLLPVEWFWFVYIIQIVNISGAAGDIYVMNIIRKAPADTLVCDAGVSMKLYSQA